MAVVAVALPEEAVLAVMCGCSNSCWRTWQSCTKVPLASSRGREGGRGGGVDVT